MGKPTGKVMQAIDLERILGEDGSVESLLASKAGSRRGFNFIHVTRDSAVHMGQGEDLYHLCRHTEICAGFA